MSLGDETARTREALKAGVAASVHDLIEEAQRLVLWTRRFVLIGVAVLAVGLFTATFTTINQFQVRHIAHQNRDNGNAIRDCTTPQHTCYERGQMQTGVAITKLALAFCAGIHPHDPAGAQQCGVAALAALKGKP